MKSPALAERHRWRKEGLMSESLSELETELCRLPGVIVTRFVGGSGRRPLGVTAFVAAGTTPGRVRAGIQAIASVHFDIEIDPARMVVIDVGEAASVAGGPAPSPTPVAEAPPVTDPVDHANGPRVDVAASDGSEALAAAQQAVHILLSRLASSLPEDDDEDEDEPESVPPPVASVEEMHPDTVVVNGSDTADAAPASLRWQRRAEDSQHGA